MLISKISRDTLEYLRSRGFHGSEALDGVSLDAFPYLLVSCVEPAACGYTSNVILGNWYANALDVADAVCHYIKEDEMDARTLDFHYPWLYEVWCVCDETGPCLDLDVKTLLNLRMVNSVASGC